MKGFPFKRHLIVLGAAILLLGIMVPLATFAKSSSGEPHRPLIQSKVTRSIDPATSLLSIGVSTDALCGTSSTTINTTPFPKGVDVVGKAKVTPTDPTDTQEATEGETLVLLEQNSSFTKPVKTSTGLFPISITDGLQAFSFRTGANNDTLTACINGADGDESASISVSFIPVPAPVPTPKPPTIPNPPLPSGFCTLKLHPYFTLTIFQITSPFQHHFWVKLGFTKPDYTGWVSNGKAYILFYAGGNVFDKVMVNPWPNHINDWPVHTGFALSHFQGFNDPARWFFVYQC